MSSGAIVETANIVASNDDNNVVMQPLTQAHYRQVPLCRYYLRGICRFGELCRFSHNIQIDAGSPSTSVAEMSGGFNEEQLKPSTSSGSFASAYNWINAPVFVPGSGNAESRSGARATAVSSFSTYADVVGKQEQPYSNSMIYGTVGVITRPNLKDEVCPYELPCPYVPFCVYGVHYELCKMCDKYCLHPNDLNQRREHNKECLQLHEQDMEFSFAIARSKDKTCGICFDTIMEKTGHEKRFGILPNCSHIFCLECIRKWRQAKQFEHKITRSCPECRIASDYVCPSAFWVETKEQKDKLLNDYLGALNKKDCKYFKRGDGKCPFGNKCFYKHALPNGELVDVGNPRRSRKLRSSSNNYIDLLDIYLWDFVDRRDYQWVDLHSSSNDDSDGSDYSDDDLIRNE